MSKVDNRNYIRTTMSRVVIGTALILCVPLVAMQFSDEVVWGPFDFIVIGTMLIVAGSVYAVLSSTMKEKSQRFAFLVATIITLAWLWIELAVGLFTNWGS